MFSSIQIYLFLKCLLFGICFGFVYSIYNLFKPRLNIFISATFDFILFFIAGLGQFLIFLTQNYAKTALFGVVATIIGFIVALGLVSFAFSIIIKLIKKPTIK